MSDSTSPATQQELDLAELRQLTVNLGRLVQRMGDQALQLAARTERLANEVAKSTSAKLEDAKAITEVVEEYKEVRGALDIVIRRLNTLADDIGAAKTAARDSERAALSTMREVTGQHRTMPMAAPGEKLNFWQTIALKFFDAPGQTQALVVFLAFTIMLAGWLYVVILKGGK